LTNNPFSKESKLFSTNRRNCRGLGVCEDDDEEEPAWPVAPEGEGVYEEAPEPDPSRALTTAL